MNCRRLSLEISFALYARLETHQLLNQVIGRFPSLSQGDHIVSGRGVYTMLPFRVIFVLMGTGVISFHRPWLSRKTDNTASMFILISNVNLPG